MDETLPPFLTKTYDMVDDPSTNRIISWSLSNRSFVVWNQSEFIKELLPKCFRHNNFSSFIRQLNAYGFRKVDPARWEFANDDFRKGRRDLLKNIQTRKLNHCHSMQVIQELRRSSLSPLNQSERQKFEKEIERLNHEKGLLFLQLKTQMEEQDRIKLRMQSLEDRLHCMEYRQHQMMSALAQSIQKPGYVSDLMHKRRRLLTMDSFNGEHAAILWNSNQACGENNTATGLPLQNIDVGVNNLLPGIPQSTDFGPSSLNLGNTSNSSELVQSIEHVELPIATSMQVNSDTGNEFYTVATSSKQAYLLDKEDEELEEAIGVGTGTLIVQSRANDVFWGQGLTENLGSCDLQPFLSDELSSFDIHDSL